MLTMVLVMSLSALAACGVIAVGLEILAGRAKPILPERQMNQPFQR